MQGYDLTILVKVTTKPAYGSDHSHFMTVRDGLMTALNRLVKADKIHENSKIEQLDPANLKLVETITETIDTKVDAKIIKLQDDLEDQIRELRRQLPGG